jgi:flagellar protein FlbD
MIHLTRINRVPLVLNSDLIEHVEATPDTVISLTTGQKILVLESPGEIVDRVVQFRRSVGGMFNAFVRGPHAEPREIGPDSTHPGLEPRT